MNPTTVCLAENEVDQLLTGELDAARMSELELHLSDCIDCRCTLEQSIGDETWWHQTEASLRGDSREQHAGHQADSSQQLLALLGPTDDPAMLGRIGRYEISGLLGHGGMGAVFKGFDRSLNRFVAIKMLLPHLATSGAARRRFEREGQAVAAVVDDHVMAIHCVDQWRGIPYLVMNWSQGESLQKRLSASGPLELREILRIGMQTARGLAAAHAQGIVHRDI
ncbi:MAG: serine/threonine protein kinase, partial [Planctomycetaceae bacterium]|nr:serine/threonine protein kinase [Planctomycetaceae bacterium]